MKLAVCGNMGFSVQYSRQARVRNDVLSYNSRNELIGATLGADAYAYDFDNIGNRKSAAEQGEDWSYLSNELNQYARITQDGTPPLESVIFTPQYDADGNQTLLETQTGIWSVTYDAFNRPIRFTSQDETIIIESSYDSMGRRVNKKVTQNGAVSLHQRYLYRGYLQIACIDMTRSGLNGMWMITWDPTQASATRPLALQKDGTWFCYGTDLSKNITEVYKNNGTIATAYTYAPFGQVVASGSTTQPLQWSSEYYDTELGLVYYNYRHYNPKDGRWINRDPIGIEGGYNLYAYVGNSTEWLWDINGLESVSTKSIHQLTCKCGEKLSIELSGSFGFAIGYQWITGVGITGYVSITAECDLSGTGRKTQKGLEQGKLTIGVKWTLSWRTYTKTNYGMSLTGAPTSWETTHVGDFVLNHEIETIVDTSENCCPKGKNGV